MAKLISPDALVSKKAKLEKPVRVFAFAGVQAGAKIGRYTYINRHSFVHRSVTMGRYCSIARAADVGAEGHRMDLLSTHPFQHNSRHFEGAKGYKDFERTLSDEVLETTIGNDVWIGAKAVVAAGVNIGTGAVVGALSFVREDVPPYAIVVGTPARVIKYRFEPDVITRLLASKWWELLPQDMEGVAFDNIDSALVQIASIHKRKAEEKARKEAEEEARLKAEDEASVAMVNDAASARQSDHP